MTKGMMMFYGGIIGLIITISCIIIFIILEIKRGKIQKIEEKKSSDEAYEEILILSQRSNERVDKDKTDETFLMTKNDINVDMMEQTDVMEQTEIMDKTQIMENTEIME